MKSNLKIHTNQYFKILTEEYGFILKTEIDDGEYYLVEYASTRFVFKIEKYFRELYSTVYSHLDPNKEIGFYNLLEYLNFENREIPRMDFFHSEKILEDAFKKQLQRISSDVYKYLTIVNNFYSAEQYELNYSKFEQYWKSRYPELYKSI